MRAHGGDVICPHDSFCERIVEASLTRTSCLLLFWPPSYGNARRNRSADPGILFASPGTSLQEIASSSRGVLTPRANLELHLLQSVSDFLGSQDVLLPKRPGTLRCVILSSGDMI